MRVFRWLILLALLLAAAFLAVGLFAPQAMLRGWQALEAARAGAAVQVRVVDDHRWSWLEAGSGPPLVLLHGFTGAKENWLPIFAGLARDHRVIAPDLPGWGDSSRIPGADYGFAAQALRVNAWLAALQLHEVVLVGHSMGGGIAAVAAAQGPPALRGLVLVDAAGVPFAANAFAGSVQAGGHPFAVASGVELRRYLALVFEDPPWVPWPLSRALVQRRRAGADFEQRVLEAIGRGTSAFVPQQAAASIAVPTLLLWCAGDRIIDPSAITAWRRAIGAEVKDTVLLEGCNHMPMMEQPDATAAALRRFTTALP